MLRKARRHRAVQREALAFPEAVISRGVHFSDSFGARFGARFGTREFGLDSVYPKDACACLIPAIPQTLDQDQMPSLPFP